jgi:NADH-quinone oxidoreductase subunit L
MYNVLFVRQSIALGRKLWNIVDTRIIDGLGPNGAAWLSGRLAVATGKLQTGYVYHYAFATLLGLFAFVSWLFYSVWVG